MSTSAVEGSGRFARSFHRSKTAFLWSVLLFSSGLPGSVVAQAAGETEAQALFRRGVEALRAEQYAAAAGAFESSYALDPKPAALCNMALAYDRWGDHALAAVKAYQRCARTDDSGRFREYALTRAEALLGTLSVEERARMDGSTRAEPPDDSGESTRETAVGAEALPGEDDEGPPVDRSGGFGEDSSDIPAGRPAIEVREGRSHPLLYIGIGAGVLAAGALVAGILLVSSANSDIDELDRKYGGTGQVVIPAGSADARLFMDAEDKTDLGVIMYVASGVLALAAGTLIAVDLALPDVGVSVSEQEVVAQIRLRFDAL